MKIGKMGMLLIGLVTVAIVGLIAIPNFVRDPYTSPANACIENLRLIDVCKQQWALDHNRTNGLVSWNDIIPYTTRFISNIPSVWKSGMLHCPSGGTYTIGRIEELPTCTIPRHSLDPAQQQERHQWNQPVPTGVHANSRNQRLALLFCVLIVNGHRQFTDDSPAAARAKTGWPVSVTKRRECICQEAGNELTATRLPAQATEPAAPMVQWKATKSVSIPKTCNNLPVFSGSFCFSRLISSRQSPIKS